jgi:hypothetical protein
MSRASRAASLWWYDLQQNLGGSFTARARGLLATKFALLSPGGEKFGQLRLRGSSVAEFESGDHAATFKRSARSYRMVADGEEVLAATPKGSSIDELEISCGSGQTYEAKVSFLRNLAVASYPGGERVVRLSGGLTSRSYEVLFAAEDACALPVALFLLWHVTANRRRAYRMGSPTRGGAM